MKITDDISDIDCDNWLAQLESLEESGVTFPADYKQFLGNFIDDISDLDSPNDYIALKNDDEEALAMASYKHNKSGIEIDYMAVAPMYHPRVVKRTGLGSTLFAEIIKFAKQKKAHKITLTSLNSDSDVFYEKLGMTKCGEIDKHNRYKLDL